MTIFEVAQIAKRYDTEIAHATLYAVAVAKAEGRNDNDLIGVPQGWGLDEED